MSFDYLMGYIISISMCMQSFITIVHSVRPFSSQYSTQFSYFHFFRIWASATPRPIQNDIWQSLGLHFVNIDAYAKFYQNIPNGSRVKSSLFSEFEPRQTLDQSQMSFDYLMGYIISISMCMQSFITIVHSVRPFSLFQNLELGTASTDVKCHFAIFRARFCNPSV